MAAYISRKAALEYIKSVQCKTCSDIGLCGGCAVLVAVRLLEKVPAADVAPVVRCKDCKYGDYDSKPDGAEKLICENRKRLVTPSYEEKR